MRPGWSGWLSNLKGAARTIAPRLRPGDLVLSMEPGQLTTLYHYLPPGMRYATSMGLVRDPGSSTGATSSTASSGPTSVAT